MTLISHTKSNNIANIQSKKIETLHPGANVDAKWLPRGKHPLSEQFFTAFKREDEA